MLQFKLKLIVVLLLYNSNSLSLQTILIIKLLSVMTDNEFDLNVQEVDAFCINHDIDDYDLYGEIKAEDGDGSGFGEDIDFGY